MWKKIWFNYDPGVALWIYPYPQKNSHDIRLSHFVGVQLNGRNQILGVEVLYPEEQLPLLTGRKVSKAFLHNLVECRLKIESKGLSIVHFALYSKGYKKPVIGTLTIPESLYSRKVEAVA